VALTVAVEVFPPETTPGPLQLKVAPAEAELALIVPLVTRQVNERGAPAVAVGGVVLELTTTVPTFVQPVAGLVTVTVYVPDIFIVAVFVVPPETTPGPPQL
jgi:hypothetical protein